MTSEATADPPGESTRSTTPRTWSSASAARSSVATVSLPAWAPIGPGRLRPGPIAAADLDQRQVLTVPTGQTQLGPRTPAVGEQQLGRRIRPLPQGGEHLVAVAEPVDQARLQGLGRRPRAGVHELAHPLRRQ